MKFVLCATIFLAVAFAVSGREIPEDELSTRIIGGSNANHGKYLYQVSLRVYFEHFCGGSVLNKRWVLTAAHCIYDKRPDEISVVTGTHLLSEAGVMRQAEYKIEHPMYNEHALFANNVGLIYVSTDMIFTDRTRPIALPTSEFAGVNSPAVLAGWGARKPGGNLMNRLQQITVNVIPQASCAAKHAKLTATQMCTQTKAGGGPCTGDDGGPLVVDGVQIGILSSVESCLTNEPAVYARVWSFVPWISQAMKLHEETLPQ